MRMRSQLFISSYITSTIAFTTCTFLKTPANFHIRKLNSAKSFDPINAILDSDDSSHWYSFDQINSISSSINIPVEEIFSHHVDVTYDADGYQHDPNSSAIYRIRPKSIIPSLIMKHGQFLGYDSIHLDEVSRIEKAAECTYRWCSNFVQHLNLCPWAKQSLSSDNAIRIKVVDQKPIGFKQLVKVVRDSSIELKCLVDNGLVDPYIGISFVVFLPDCGTSGNDEETFQFLPFYEMFNELEEYFLDELSDNDGNYIGEAITVAPFHPRWSFASSNLDKDNDFEDPINYEKRTPYPTISIVMSKGIDLAGEEVTARIGVHNEEVLNEVGVSALRELYHNTVLQDE